MSLTAEDKKSKKLEIIQYAQLKLVYFMHIVQCHYSGSGGFTRCELCYRYMNIGKQRKTRQRLASGFISVFLFYVLTVLPILSLSAPLYGLFSASAYSLTFFLFVA